MRQCLIGIGIGISHHHSPGKEEPWGQGHICVPPEVHMEAGALIYSALVLDIACAFKSPTSHQIRRVRPLLCGATGYSCIDKALSVCVCVVRGKRRRGWWQHCSNCA